MYISWRTLDQRAALCNGQGCGCQGFTVGYTPDGL
jgi:hypothetical protein